MLQEARLGLWEFAIEAAKAKREIQRALGQTIHRAKAYSLWQLWAN
jgi:hypothetical protein